VVIETLPSDGDPEREVLEVAAAGGGVAATVVSGTPIYDRVQDATG
jgi:hypothetical protein